MARAKAQAFNPATYSFEEWPPELDHISASSLSMFTRCPEQWRRRYALGERRPPVMVGLWGRADHKAIEADLSNKLFEGEHLPVDDVRELFVVEFEAQLDREGGLSEVDFGRKVGTDDAKRALFARSKDNGAYLAGLYREQVSPTLSPLTLEQQFTLSLPGLPVPLVGYTDLTADTPA